MTQRIGGGRPTLGWVLALAFSGCAQTPMETYVPAHCHGAAESFSTYRVAHENVPGFIEAVIDTAARGALERQGLVAAADPSRADIELRTEFELIDRNPPKPRGDPFGETVAPSEINRFVTHLIVRIVDLRTGKLIWTGAMDRAHAIQGGETFHDERAVLIITQAFDGMFVGLTTPCE